MRYSRLLIPLILAGCSESSPTAAPYVPPDPIVAETPQRRVNAFIQDWYATWAHVIAADPVVARSNSREHMDSMVDQMSSAKDLEEGLEKLRAAMPTAEDIKRLSEKWGHTEYELERRHFTESGVGPETYRGYSHQADHDPSLESITDLKYYGDSALVETASGQDITRYYVYELKRLDGDWRIQRIRSYLAVAGARAFSVDEIENLFADTRPDAQLPELGIGIEPNCEKLFAEGREVTFLGKPVPIKVRDAGTVEFSSGRIGACDLGWHQDGFTPLSRSVPSGKYRADYAEADGLVIAARIHFQEDQKVAQWRPAVRIDGKNHVVGVDCANVAFFDAEAYMRLSMRELEDCYQEWLDVSLAKSDPQLTALMALESGPQRAPDCVVFTSGGGDGGYPVYWGLDSQGEVVSLVADFQVAGQVLEETITLDWSLDEAGQQLRHPSLEKFGVEVSVFTHNQFLIGFKVTGDRFQSARILDADGETIVDTARSTLRSDFHHDVYSNRAPLAEIKPTAVEITLTTGYRN